MIWNLLTKGDYSFYFQEQYLNGVDRDKWNKFKETIRTSNDPRSLAIASCPKHQFKLILPIPDTEFFVAIRLHDENNLHPTEGKCIILIKIAKLIDFTN